jgi:hypothetical protein
MHACALARMCTLIHKHTHTHTHHARTLPRMCTHTHTHVRACINTQSHTYTNTRTYIHTQMVRRAEAQRAQAQQSHDQERVQQQRQLAARRRSGAGDREDLGEGSYALSEVRRVREGGVRVASNTQGCLSTPVQGWTSCMF